MRTILAAVAAATLLVGCGATAEPAPTVTITAPASPAPTVTVTVTAPAPAPVVPAPAKPSAALDLTTDAGICAADADLTNLELNDALAPLLGYPADRRSRTDTQNQAIRDYKNAALKRACPARAS